MANRKGTKGQTHIYTHNTES